MMEVICSRQSLFLNDGGPPALPWLTSSKAPWTRTSCAALMRDRGADAQERSSLAIVAGPEYAEAFRACCPSLFSDTPFPVLFQFLGSMFTDVVSTWNAERQLWAAALRQIGVRLLCQAGPGRLSLYSQQ